MKKICVITGTRADYGLLYWTMKRIQEDSELELSVLATCMHLSEKFGSTWKQIEEDGFPITKKVDLGEQLDSTKSITGQVGRGVEKFHDAFKEIDPDLIIILGDRYEMLSAAISATFLQIPIAHIHGGEVTEGAFDDMIRHSITKMSSYHFTSTQTYANRVIQMGESPQRVLNVGAVGLENILNSKLLTREELENNLNFKFMDKNILVTYHPVTADSEDGIEELIAVLEKRSELGQIITMPNSDPGHKKIFDALQNYAANKENVHLVTSLGFLRYLSAMSVCDVVVGNSSSGIIEAPFLAKSTLNIGSRQKGRMHDTNIINCDADRKSIDASLSSALKMTVKKSFMHGDGDVSVKIIKSIKEATLEVKKGFFDLSK